MELTVTSAASTALVAMDPAAALAMTGLEAPRWSAALGGIAVALGVGFVFLARRRRRDAA